MQLPRITFLTLTNLDYTLFVSEQAWLPLDKHIQPFLSSKGHACPDVYNDHQQMSFRCCASSVHISHLTLTLSHKFPVALSIKEATMGFAAEQMPCCAHISAFEMCREEV